MKTIEKPSTNNTAGKKVIKRGLIAGGLADSDAELIDDPGLPFFFEIPFSFDLIVCIPAYSNNGKMTDAGVSKYAYNHLRNLALTPIETH